MSRAKKRKITLAILQEKAAERGGKCLAQVYTRIHDLYWWEDKNGHRWKTTANSVLRGSWSPDEMVNRTHTLKEVQIYAEWRGGKTLAKVYDASKMLMECGEKHTWSPKPHTMLYEMGWCPQCRGKASFGEAICRAVATALFGYPFARAHPQWLLSEKARPMELDMYCDELSFAIEWHGDQHRKPVTFGRSGKSIKPAIEVLFERQLKRDARRRSICEGNGVHLAELSDAEPFDTIEPRLRQFAAEKGIPVVTHDPIDWHSLEIRQNPVIYDRVLAYVESKGGELLTKAFPGARRHVKIRCHCGCEWPAMVTNLLSQQTWCPDCSPSRPLRDDPEEIAALQAWVAKKEGELLTPVEDIQSAKQSLTFKCKGEHTWKADWAAMKFQRSWCSKCVGRRKFSFEELQAEAATLGFTIVSPAEEYKVVRGTALTVACACGCRFPASVTSIRAKSFRCQNPDCQEIGRSLKPPRRTLAELQAVCEKQGGECLDLEIHGVSSKHRFRCKIKHEWTTTANSVFMGTWCRICKCGEGNLGQLQEIAAKNKGECLSNVYVNNYTHLEFKCDRNHRWPASPGNIKQGKWCPECAKEKRAKAARDRATALNAKKNAP